MLAAILIGSSAPSQALPPGLVSWYRAENNALDAQGVSNGTQQGTVNYAPGAVGQGFSLENSGYIDVASPTLNASAAAFTIAGWFTITNPAGQPALLNFRNLSNNSGFTLEQDNGGQINFSIAKTGGGGVFTTLFSTGWALNTAYYVAATFDGSVMDIYRDGSLLATRTDAVDTTATVTSPQLQIGRNIANNSLWDGKIDEVQFYNRALTQPEVASLVPEPGTVSMMILGIVSLGGFASRRRRIRA